MFEVFVVYPWLFIGLTALLGVCFGSFSNVVIHRLPAAWDREMTAGVVEWADLAATQPDQALARVPAAERVGLQPRLREMADTLRAILKMMPRETLTRPRSRCPNCGHGITAAENIPVFSYLALRGRCSACKTPISPRYPLIEAFCGLVAGAIAWKFGVSLQYVAALALFFWLVPLAMIDADTTYLANSSTLPLLWTGLIFNLFGVFAALPDAVLGVIVGYLFLAVPAWTYEALKRTGENAMGRGDFVLMAVLGAWFGWPAILPIVLLSCCVGIAVAVPFMLGGKRGLQSKIPFGPYIAGAGVVYLFAGNALKAWLGLLL